MNFRSILAAGAGLACLLFVQSAAFAQNAAPQASFRWCQPLAAHPTAVLLASHVAPLPDDFATRSHAIVDGTWIYERSLQDVWNTYARTPIANAWTSRWVLFRNAIDHDGVARGSALAVGRRYFFDINGDGLGIFCQLGMGIKVTAVRLHHLIKMEYLDFSPAHGQQEIRFEALSASRTRVTHVTRYLGRDEWIDFFYPIMHREAIPRLHQSARTLLNR